jgi:hypothetical protein
LQQYCNKQLAAFRKYKHFIAASLLAIYMFVATPVQWWHHHNTGSAAVSHNTRQTAVAKATAANSDSGCQICSHKYSAYNDDALVPFVSSLLIPAAKNGHYHLPVIITRSFSLSNKGPPSLS